MLIDNNTYQRETLLERPIRQPLMYVVICVPEIIFFFFFFCFHHMNKYVMHSNKTGNKLHRPILRYGQLQLA